MESTVKIAMISQPMAGKSDEEIKAARESAKMHLEALGYGLEMLYEREWNEE